MRCQGQDGGNDPKKAAGGADQEVAVVPFRCDPIGDPASTERAGGSGKKRGHTQDDVCGCVAEVLILNQQETGPGRKRAQPEPGTQSESVAGCSSRHAGG